MRTHNYIRVLRRQAGLSQSQMAVRLQTLGLDVGQPWISKVERGIKPLTDEELPYVALVLGVTPNDLLRWEEFVRAHRS